MKQTILMTLALACGIATRAGEPSAIRIDKETRTVSIACKVAPRKLPKLSEV